MKEKIKFLNAQSFCEDINKLRGSRNIREGEKALLDSITHKVTTRLDVFGTLMGSMFFSDIKSRLTITKQKYYLEW